MFPLFNRTNGKNRSQSSARKSRTLRLESLDRREMMDGYGLTPEISSHSSSLDTQFGETSAWFASSMAESGSFGLVAEGEGSSSSSSNSSSSSTQSSPRAISIGSVLNDSISVVGQVDRFSFQAVANGSYQLGLSSNTNGLNLNYRVYAPGSNTPVLTGGVSTAVFNNISNTRAGTYIVEVQATSGQSTGSYSIGVEGRSLASLDSVTLPRGRTVGGTIAHRIDVDQYKFQVNANESFQIAIVARTQGVHVNWQLFAPGATAPVLSGTAGGGQAARIERFTGGTSGTYLLLVREQEGVRVAGYTVGLESVSKPSPDARLLTRGQTQNRTIGATAQVDQYQFQVNRNESFQIAIAARTQGVHITWQLYAPGASTPMLTGTAGGGQAARIERFSSNSTSGIYVLQVRELEGIRVGAYTVGLEAVSSPSVDAKILARGQTQNGQISQTAQVDQYKFHVNANQTMQIAIAARTQGVHMTWQLYAPGATMPMRSGTAGGGQSARIERFSSNSTPGTYLLLVRELEGIRNGSYAVGLTSLSAPNPDATSLSPNATINRSLTSAVQVDQYKFSLAQGKSTQITLRPITTGLVMHYEIYAPGGTSPVKSGAFGSQTIVNLTALQQGPYVLVIRALDGIQTGNYRVRRTTT